MENNKEAQKRDNFCRFSAFSLWVRFGLILCVVFCLAPRLELKKSIKGKEHIRMKLTVREPGFEPES